MKLHRRLLVLWAFLIVQVFGYGFRIGAPLGSFSRREFRKNGSTRVGISTVPGVVFSESRSTLSSDQDKDNNRPGLKKQCFGGIFFTRKSRFMRLASQLDGKDHSAATLGDLLAKDDFLKGFRSEVVSLLLASGSGEADSSARSTRVAGLSEKAKESGCSEDVLASALTEVASACFVNSIDGVVKSFHTAVGESDSTKLGEYFKAVVPAAVIPATKIVTTADSLRAYCFPNAKRAFSVQYNGDCSAKDLEQLYVHVAKFSELSGGEIPNGEELEALRAALNVKEAKKNSLKSKISAIDMTLAVTDTKKKGTKKSAQPEESNEDGGEKGESGDGEDWQNKDISQLISGAERKRSTREGPDGRSELMKFMDDLFGYRPEDDGEDDGEEQESGPATLHRSYTFYDSDGSVYTSDGNNWKKVSGNETKSGKGKKPKHAPPGDFPDISDLFRRFFF